MSESTDIYQHTVEMSIRWSDMDALGHVNNSVFFTYFEQARIEWWKHKNFPHFTLQESGPVLITASCTFLKPIIFPKTLLIKIYVRGQPGRSSFQCIYQIYTKEDADCLFAEGETKIVWVSRKTGKSTALPDYILKIWEQ